MDRKAAAGLFPLPFRSVGPTNLCFGLFLDKLWSFHVWVIARTRARVCVCCCVCVYVCVCVCLCACCDQGCRANPAGPILHQGVRNVHPWSSLLSETPGLTSVMPRWNFNQMTQHVIKSLHSGLPPLITKNCYLLTTPWFTAYPASVLTNV